LITGRANVVHLMPPMRGHVFNIVNRPHLTEIQPRSADKSRNHPKKCGKP
jgi:hypothetical protein